MSDAIISGQNELFLSSIFPTIAKPEPGWIHTCCDLICDVGFLAGSVVKNLPANTGD